MLSKLRSLSVLHVVLLQTLLLSTYIGATETYNKVRVKGVTEGDTLTVVVNRNRQEIKLYGVDCPEPGQPYWEEAKKFVSSAVLGRPLEMISYGVDEDGRMIAVIINDGINLNEMLIKYGWAWRYTKYCKKSFCDDWISLENKARSKKTGLWKDKNPIAPWEWQYSPQKIELEKKRQDKLRTEKIKLEEKHQDKLRAQTAKKNQEEYLRQKARKSGIKLELVSWRWYNELGYAYAKGQVKNISDKPIRNLQVVVQWFTADDQFITHDTAFVEFKPLMPGQSSPFEVIESYNPLMKKANISFKEFGGNKLNAFEAQL